MSFAGWFIMNGWLTVPEAPALHVLWHDGYDIRCVRGASWTKRARKVGFGQEFEVCDNDHLCGRL